MKKYLIVLLFGLSLAFSSCATILNGRMQDVQLKSNADNTEFYVEGKKVGEGKQTTTKVERDTEPKQITLKNKDYMDYNTVILQDNKSPFYVMSIIPFGILIAPMLFDTGSNSWDYEKLYDFSYQTKKITWNENLKRIHLDKISVDLPEEKHQYCYQWFHDFYEKKEKYTKVENLDSIRFKNTYLSDNLFDILKDNGFVDTTNVIFHENHNTYKLHATLKEFYLIDIFNTYMNQTGFTDVGIYTEGMIEWQLKDIYDNVIYTGSNHTVSGAYSLDYYDKEDAVRNSIVDLFEKSMYKYLSSDNVSLLIERNNLTNVDYKEAITINKPETKIANIDDAIKAVVTIKSKNGHGSGFLISNNGYLVTNYHVIAGNEDDLEVIFNDGSKVKPVIVRENEIYDVALLKVDKDCEFAYQIPNEKIFSTGDDIFAIGTPKSVELGQSVTKGIISSIRKYKSNDWIQTDVSVNPGNSGGSIVNKSGDLIGIVNFKVMGYGFEGLSFCIPAYNLEEILELEYKN